jgi:hypothetical protein
MAPATFTAILSQGIAPRQYTALSIGWESLTLRFAKQAVSCHSISFLPWTLVTCFLCLALFYFSGKKQPQEKN